MPSLIGVGADVATSSAADLTDAVPSGLSTIDWVVAIAMLVGGLVVAALARRLIRRIFERMGSTPHASSLLGRMLQAVIVLVALIYALGVIGVRITPLLGALGIGGIAVALALQPALENLFAGLVLHAQRPMRLGEEIVTGDVQGTVVDISSRAVMVRTYQGETVYIPNSVVIDREIVNLVREGARRSTVVVGVGYSTDLRRAERELRRAVASVSGVAEEPSPAVLVAELAESSINFEVDYWHGPDQATLRQVRSEVIRSIVENLGAAGIEIPFPQRTLWWGADPEVSPREER